MSNIRRNQYIELFIDKVIPNVMLDGTILLHRNTREKYVKFLLQNMNDFTFFLPKTLFEVLKTNDDERFNEIKAFYRIIDSNIGDVRSRVNEIENSIKLFEISNKKIEYLLEDPGHNYFYNNLINSWYPKVVQNLIFEEWVFLQENSWLISTLKKIFSTIKRIGPIAVIVEYSKELWEIFLNHFDKHVRNEFKIPENNIIVNAERLRYLGKWVGRNFPDLFMMHPYFTIPAIIGKKIMGFWLVDK